MQSPLSAAPPLEVADNEGSCPQVSPAPPKIPAFVYFVYFVVPLPEITRSGMKEYSRPLAQFAENLRLRAFAPLLFIRFSAFTIETPLDYKLKPNVLSGDPARCYALATR